MAVIDTPVHEKVKEESCAKWGCWNRPSDFKHGYCAPNGTEYLTGTCVIIKTKYIEFSMSNECRNDVSLTDRKCEGCKHRGSGERYSEFVRSNGS